MRKSARQLKLKVLKVMQVAIAKTPKLKDNSWQINYTVIAFTFFSNDIGYLLLGV